MQRKKFSREFKLDAVRLVRERGVSVAQASRDLDVHQNVLHKWVREFTVDPRDAFPGHGQMKPEQLEMERLRREVAKLSVKPAAAQATELASHDLRLRIEIKAILYQDAALRGLSLETRSTKI